MLRSTKSLGSNETKRARVSSPSQNISTNDAEEEFRTNTMSMMSSMKKQLDALVLSRSISKDLPDIDESQQLVTCVEWFGTFFQKLGLRQKWKLENGFGHMDGAAMCSVPKSTFKKNMFNIS